MEGTISKYEDNLNDFAVGAVLAAAAYTDEDLEYVVDQWWSKNDDKKDIVNLILESIDRKHHDSYKKRVLRE